MELYLTKWAEISKSHSRLIKKQLSCWTLCQNHSISYSNSCLNTKHNFSLKISFLESGSLNLPTLHMHNSKITGPKLMKFLHKLVPTIHYNFHAQHFSKIILHYHEIISTIQKVQNWIVWTKLSMNDDIRLQMS